MNKLRKLGMNKPLVAYMLAAVGVCLPGTAPAAEGTALGIKASTLGIGLELTQSLAPHANLRVGVNGYSYDFTDTEAGIRYKFELDLRTGALLLDWHPFGGTFRVTAGGFYNKNELSARASGTLDIGNSTYTNATADASVTFKKGAPYLGIGWGNPVARNKRFGFGVELGVLFQGSPDVELSATANGTPVNPADVDREEAQLESELADYDKYYVIGLTFSYKF